MAPSYVQAGPVGGTGGDEVSPWAMPNDGTIVRIEVKWGAYINQLLFHYASPSSGQGVISLGGYTSGTNHVDIPLAQGEQIMSLGGKCGEYVDSITLVTSTPGTPNRFVKEYGSFGGPGGQPFAQFDVPQGARFAGLFGRAGAWTDALGVVYFLTPLTAPHA
ncbi:MAG: jacalin-like lectin [Chthoniobacterales bacterium]